MRPAWLDTQEYPFDSKYLEVDAGRMHYIDEGAGAPIVMLHGNPTWSFLYRNVVKKLSKHYRCIAIDLIGFGLSDKPDDWGYYPQEQVENVEQLLKQLKLKNITLLVHDLGAAVGFAYAMKHTDNVKNIVLFNTWTWPLSKSISTDESGEKAEGPLSRFIHARLHETNTKLIHELFGNEVTLPENILNQYINGLGQPGQLVNTLPCTRSLPRTRKWLNELWQHRKIIQDIPALILWGEGDKLVKAEALQKWKDFFHESYVIQFENSGHFLQEQNAEEVARYIDNFIKEEKKKHEATPMSS